jgi:aminoglycoside phosphotransferase (APT) family kinase protein
MGVDVGYQPGKLIALGRTAEIYAWGSDHILKLFLEGWSGSHVEYEAQVSRIVRAAGLPIPAVEKVVEIDGRPGLIYQRVAGPSMLAILKEKPWKLTRLARLLADLHVSMHACHVPQLTPQRQRLEANIIKARALPAQLKDATLRKLAELPDGDRLCHGDFHMDNVLLTSSGPVIIDWPDATRGNPLSDVARTSLLQRFSAPPPGESIPKVLDLARRWVDRTYLNRYFQVASADRGQFTAWLPIVAAARLSEEVNGEEETLLALIEGQVSK